MNCELLYLEVLSENSKCKSAGNRIILRFIGNPGI